MSKLTDHPKEGLVLWLVGLMLIAASIFGSDGFWRSFAEVTLGVACFAVLRVAAALDRGRA